MNGCILGLATANPPYEVSQNEIQERILEIFSFDSHQEQQVKNLYKNSGIHKRHLVIPDFKKNRSEWHFWGSDFPKIVPGTTKRNELYKKEAPLLAHQAAQKAIQAWGGDPSTITHVISASCTGTVIPGIEFSLVDSLGLQRTVYRLGINFMGCFGAIKGLEVGNAFAKANPNSRILLVCTELCSLHLQTELNYDNLLASSLFADGAAAAVIGCNPKRGESPLWEIVKHYSFGLENSVKYMGWEASDHGFLMRLSDSVPRIIARYIRPFTEAFMKPHVEASDCDWAIHPGGKAVLQVIEKKLGLEEWQTQASWNTLANYGNMSSATFLFVLDALSRQAGIKQWTVGLGFGPGLSMEGILLHR